MSRQTGSANLSASIEPLAGAPLDARSIVPTLADLTVGSNFPYKYIGMEVYVVAEDKKYRLINMDTTQSSSWKEIGEGGGSTYTAGGGIVIDNDEISVDEMASSDMEEIVTPLPSVMSRRFKYSTEEQVIDEWIDGKPLYQKSYVKTTGLTNGAWVSMGNLPSNVSPIGVKTSIGICHTSPDDMTLPIPCYSSDENTSISINRNGVDIKLNRNSTSWDYACVTLQYTKTTD